MLVYAAVCTVILAAIAFAGALPALYWITGLLVTLAGTGTYTYKLLAENSTPAAPNTQPADTVAH